MTLPNKLTMARLVMALVTFAALWARRPSLYAAALALYILATITDWIDGYLARKTHSISPFGIMADPIADKVLVIGALIAFVRDPLLHAPGWAVFLLIVRELLMGGVRALAAIQGRVLAADTWGKWSMGVQSVAVILILLFVTVSANELVRLPVSAADFAYPLVVLCMVVSVGSGVLYLRKSRHMLKKSWDAPQRGKQ